MIEFLLILFALLAYYVALQWIYDGCKTVNKDEGGKIFGGIIFLVITALVASYFLDFLYPVVVMLGILAFIFIVIGLDFLTQDEEVFFGSGKLFGVLCWIMGLIAVYPTLALMIREGWYTVSACLVSGSMVITCLYAFKRFIEKREFSYALFSTFVYFLIASCIIVNSYPVLHYAVVITDIVLLAIGCFLMYRKFRSLALAT